MALKDWLERFAATEPANRPEAERLVLAIYEKAGADSKKIALHWITNPLLATPENEQCTVFLGPFTWGFNLKAPDNEIATLFYELARNCFGVMFLDDRAYLGERPDQLVLTEDCRWHN